MAQYLLFRINLLRKAGDDFVAVDIYNKATLKNSVEYNITWLSNRI